MTSASPPSASDARVAGALPTGTLTFLFTDIEGSTRRWERDRSAMAEALARHDALVRSAVASARGTVFKTVGDAFCAVFVTAPGALAAALAAQHALAAEDWSAVGGLRVRMALHTGTAYERDGDYFGPALSRVSRILALGCGGQVLVSAAAAELVRDALPERAILHDLGRHRLRDLDVPERIWQLMAPGLAYDFAPLPSLDAMPNNLPLQVTSFVGRDADVATIAALVRGTRLVTLLGAGGIGKTRAALHVAATFLDGTRDGVWFVELAPIPDPALIPSAIALALGIALPAESDAAEALARHLERKELLVILDNCEHLVDGAARVVDAIVRACPRVRFVATSRQPLGVAGETTYRLPSLDVPDSEIARRLGATDAPAYSALALFVARARAADARFALTDEAAPAVAEICRRLDGIPLAIELAAARVPLLSPQQLRRRLDERFRLLTGGNRTTLPRQRTLRALIDWSYDLLDERERTLFRRVSVFVDGFTLNGATAVGDDAHDDLDVFDVLASLAGKSLLAADRTTDELRYRLLETTRAYASEKLDASGERERCEKRRFTYLLDLFTRAEAERTQTEREASVLVLHDEIENARGAIEWAIARGDGEAAAALFTASSLWELTGRTVETARLAQRLLALVPPQRRGARARLLRAWALAADRSFQNGRALDLAEAALVEARASNDAALLGDALVTVVTNAVRLNRLEGAARALDEAEAVAPPTPDRRSRILKARGLLARLMRDYEAAIRYDEELVGHERTLGNRHAELTAAGNLAETLHWADRTQRAVAVIAEALERLGPGVAPLQAAYGRVNLAGYYVSLDDRPNAIATIGHSIAVLLEHDREHGALSVLFVYLGTVAACDGDVAMAARAFGFARQRRSDGKVRYELTETRAAERLDAALRCALGERERLDLEAAGAAWTLDRAVEEARRVCSRPGAGRA